MTHRFCLCVAQRGAEYRDVIVARQHQLSTQGVGAAFSDAQIESWTTQLASGLAHLSERKLVHQDLHNGNVMIAGVSKHADGPLTIEDDELVSTSVKIIDLGLASFKSSRRSSSITGNGRRSSVKEDSRSSFVMVTAGDIGGFKAIRAPEMWTNDAGAGVGIMPDRVVRFNAKVDVWALGILVTEAVLLSPIEEQVYSERCAPSCHVLGGRVPVPYLIVSRFAGGTPSAQRCSRLEYLLCCRRERLLR